MFIQQTYKTTTRVSELYKVNNKTLKGKAKDIVNTWLRNDLSKFLENHHEQYRYERIYHKLIPRLNRKQSSAEAVSWLTKRCKWPNHIKDILNIAVTLKKHYGLSINKTNIKKAFTLWLAYFDKKIYPAMFNKYNLTYGDRTKDVREIHLNEKKALLEQKARGFIMTKELKKFDNKAAHVRSTINSNLIWPENLCFGIFHKDKYPHDIYITQSLVGVSGFTSCGIPKIY